MMLGTRRAILQVDSFENIKQIDFTLLQGYMIISIKMGRIGGGLERSTCGFHFTDELFWSTEYPQ